MPNLFSFLKSVPALAYKQFWRYDPGTHQPVGSTVYETALGMAPGGPFPVMDVTAPIYGADYTGVANCTAVVQAVHDAAPSTGAILYFPRGTYKFNSGINLSKPVWIVSEAANFTMAAGLILFTASEGITGLTIKGINPTWPAPAAGSLLLQKGGDRTTFENCVATNGGLFEQRIDSIDTEHIHHGLTFRKCKASNSTNNAVTLMQTQNVLFEQCEFYAMGGFGIKLNNPPCSDIVIRGCYFEGSGNAFTDYGGGGGNVTLDTCHFHNTTCIVKNDGGPSNAHRPDNQGMTFHSCKFTGNHAPFTDTGTAWTPWAPVRKVITGDGATTVFDVTTNFGYTGTMVAFEVFDATGARVTTGWTGSTPDVNTSRWTFSVAPSNTTVYYGLTRHADFAVDYYETTMASGLTTLAFTHGLKTLLADVKVWSLTQTLISAATYTLTQVDRNNFTITFGGAIPTNYRIQVRRRRIGKGPIRVIDCTFEDMRFNQELFLTLGGVNWQWRGCRVRRVTCTDLFKMNGTPLDTCAIENCDFDVLPYGAGPYLGISLNPNVDPQFGFRPDMSRLILNNNTWKGVGQIYSGSLRDYMRVRSQGQSVIDPLLADTSQSFGNPTYNAPLGFLSQQDNFVLRTNAGANGQVLTVTRKIATDEAGGTGIVTLPDGTTTVNASGDQGAYKFANSMPTTCTGITGGAVLDIVSLIGDGNTTLKNGANFVLRPPIDYLIPIGNVLRFQKLSSTQWRDITGRARITQFVDSLKAMYLFTAGNLTVDSYGSETFTSHGAPAHAAGPSGTITDAVSFGGAADSLTRASSVIWSPGNASFSLSCWVYISAFNTFIFGKGVAAGSRSYGASATGTNHLQYTVFPDGITVTPNRPESAVLVANTWYFTSYIYDAENGVLNLWVNNTKYTGVYTQGIFDVPAADFTLGGRDTVTALFNGRVAQFLNHARALQDEEITWLYNAGNGRSQSELLAQITLAT